jgi:hypothetical protein
MSFTINKIQSESSNILQQGYLQAYRNGEVVKVFAILSSNSLSVYTEDPSKQSSSAHIESIDLKKSKVLEEGNFKRPKSFGIFSDQSFFEFSCATNSARLSWLKTFQAAKDSSESISKLRDLKASMDLYRNPSLVGRQESQPSRTAQLSSQSQRLSTGANVFNDTLAQLRAIGNPSVAQNQQPQSTIPQIQSTSLGSGPNVILQPKLKKNCK